METSADVFGAIAAPVRREILQMLAHQDLPVTDIASAFSMSMSAVSQHLSILKEAQLIAVDKVGRQRIYRLTPQPLKEVTDWVEKYEGFWNSKFERLETYLEKKHEKD